jgi:hydrogenase nickel incorporation protein HypB
MCTTCGCEETGVHKDTKTVSVRAGILEQNDRMAQHNRDHFDAHDVLTINLMSSPGAGKTSLLEATIQELAGRLRVAVIEGDLATENDAVRIRAHGVVAEQITTGSACHLDAAMIDSVLHDMDLDNIDVLFIENVGNLVCPAAFDLGQHRNVVLLSTPEGDDKPSKYPVMFRAADLVLISKSDLLPYLPEFSPQRAISNVRDLGVAAPVLRFSAKTAEGLLDWVNWLTGQRAFGSSADVMGRELGLKKPTAHIREL